MNTEYKDKREEMVRKHLKARDIVDKDVLQAFLEVPREEFVPEEYKAQAYLDSPLPIGYGVTISQPYIVALMCQLLDLNPNMKVLDIGTGSGYQAAILSHLCDEVITIERIKELAEEARGRLKRLGYDNVKIVYGDGSKGYEEDSPYDGIIVAATTDEIPKAWVEQLKVGGRIIYPEGSGLMEELIEAVKSEDGIIKTSHGGVRFVPLKEGEV
jgi:protein-L-isoaspartate(D-aspartate) O-methyltransferase